MPAVTSNNQLTRTELETLAHLILSAGKHMAAARTVTGEPVWSSADYVDTWDDVLHVFYGLQDHTSGKAPVTVHG
jgi:hypothetical protein